MSNKVAGYVPVVTAVGVNIVITVLKFFGFYLSGSVAMFSEAIHSVADAGNQALLLVGVKRSQKKPDEKFHFGYGQERFLWALISACGIFFLGAGVTISHGILALVHKEKPEISSVTISILIISLILEYFISMRVALREAREKTGEKSLMKIMRHGDTTVLAIILEDGIAILGIIIALASSILTYLTGNYIWDAIGSILIGILLAIAAISLININRRYLIEVAMPEDLQVKLTRILNSYPAVAQIIELKSSTVNVDEYRVRCEIVFDAASLNFEGTINNSLQNIINAVGEEIDKLKREIQERIPGIKHLVIEISS